MQRFRFLVVVACLCWFAIDELMAAATLTTLHVFRDADGFSPQAGLVLGTNGNFYGTTTYGGTGTNECIDGCGTVFEISPGGAFTSLHSFTNGDGSAPRGGLVQASDGNLYGTTASGGLFGGSGTVFQIAPNGILTNLHTFRLADGIGPEGTLIEGPNGILYGTTSEGGPTTPGTVFQITTNGVFGFLGGVDQPAAGVILAGDGNLYGTTEFGGTSTNCIGGCGTVFKITTNGVVTTLYSFSKSDGSAPVAELVLGSDGNLYGTTSGGHTGLANCSNGCGTVFMITTNGDLTTLHEFGGNDGREPRGGLALGSDGNFYGTTSAGGALFAGTVFQITTNGALTRLISFTGANGGDPLAGLVPGSDGSFYGTTSVGGSNNGHGTVFKLTISTNSSSTTACTLSPALATNNIGATHTVTATVTTNGVARNGVAVNFSVIAGPNAGRSGSGITITAGQVSFSYTGGATPGTDTIRATSLGATGLATNVWIATDSVGDGIPDSWRAQYFGGNGATTNAQSCAACDADGTGQNNLFKYVAGLNPTNPASVFVLSARDVNGQPAHKELIYGPIAASRTYVPQFRTDLAGGDWAALTGFGGPTTNVDQVTVTDLGATEASRFYRIRISLP